MSILKHINISTLRGFSRWKPAAWLRVSGSDAAAFLQGQFSQDLRGLAAGEGRYGLWLTVKGKVLADSFVIRAAAEGEFWIVSYGIPSEVIRARLEAFIIADDVNLDLPEPEPLAVTLLGDSLPSAPAGVSVLTSRRVGCGVDWLFSAREAPAVQTALSGWAELPPAALEAERISAGRPSIPRDIGPDELPQEGGLEWDAVAFNKGCYLGQEVMARLHAMGRVRRRLLRVRGVGAVPADRQALYDGERRAGEIRSAVGDGAEFLALALLTLPLSGDLGPLAWTPGGPAVGTVLNGEER